MTKTWAEYVILGVAIAHWLVCAYGVIILLRRLNYLQGMARKLLHLKKHNCFTLFISANAQVTLILLVLSGFLNGASNLMYFLGSDYANDKTILKNFLFANLTMHATTPLVQMSLIANFQFLVMYWKHKNYDSITRQLKHKHIYN